MSEQRRCVVHIGMDKAGSTAVQAFLAGHQAQLQEHGWDYPVLIDFPKQPYFAALGLTGCDMDPVCRTWIARTGRSVRDSGTRDEVEYSLQAELEAILDSPTSRNVVLSSEDFLAFSTSSEIVRLSDVIAGHGLRLEVVVYIREPVSWTISGWSTQLRHGRSSWLPSDKPWAWSRRIDSLAKWEEALSGRVNVRLFEDARAQVGGLVGDFLQVLQVQHLNYPAGAGQAIDNQSLSWQAMRLLMGYDRVMQFGEQEASASAQCSRLLGCLKDFGSPADHYVATTEEIAAIYEHSSSSIAWLASTYFPERHHLWVEPVGRNAHSHGDFVSAPGPYEKDVARLLAALLRESQRTP